MKTVDEFRTNPEMVIRLRELLSDPVAHTALEILRNSNPPVDADNEADAIESVRILSQMTGYAAFYNTLLLMQEPKRVQKPLTAEFKPEQ